MSAIQNDRFAAALTDLQTFEVDYMEEPARPAAQTSSIATSKRRERGSRAKSRRDGKRIAEYDPWRQRAFDAIRASEENGPGPELVGATVLKIAASRTPRLRYVVGKQARVVTLVRRLLPEGAFEQGVRSTFRLDRKG